MSAKRRDAVFEDFTKWAFDERGLLPKTRRQYYWRARAADRWLTGNRAVSLIWAAPKDLQAYLFSTTPVAESRNNTRCALVCFGDFLVARGFTDLNPARSLPRLPQRRYLPKPLELEQMRRLVVLGPTFPTRDRLIVYLMLLGGLRKSEVRLLEWRHVEEGGGWIRFPGKGNRERAVPVHHLLRSALSSWRLESGDARWVFPSPYRRGQPISETTLALTVKESGEAAGIEGLHPHRLRHSFATRLLEQVGNLRTVQEALGHATPTSTAIYTKIRPTRLREAIEELSFDGEGPAPGGRGSGVRVHETEG